MHMIELLSTPPLHALHLYSTWKPQSDPCSLRSKIWWCQVSLTWHHQIFVLSTATLRPFIFIPFFHFHNFSSSSSSVSAIRTRLSTLSSSIDEPSPSTMGISSRLRTNLVIVTELNNSLLKCHWRLVLYLLLLGSSCLIHVCMHGRQTSHVWCLGHRCLVVIVSK